MCLCQLGYVGGTRHDRSMTEHLDVPTPALVLDADVVDANLAAMAAIHPGRRLRPHVKAHKCTALAAAQQAVGHDWFTCATPAEVVGMAHAGVGTDLLLANETVDGDRLRAMAAIDSAVVTVAVDSDATVTAAADAGIRHCLVDVDVGLPRCGIAPEEAGRLADTARAAGLEVRGVMGYEGHLMMELDQEAQRQQVDEAVDRLLAAHADVGGDIVSSGGTGTHHLHDTDPATGRGVTEVQAGSYVAMDSDYSRHEFPFGQALHVVATVISVRPDWAVADAGLKALSTDHGQPGVVGATAWFCSDEHLTFAPDGDRPPNVGDQVLITPSHIDPTIALHEVIWLVRDGEVVDRWPVDLRGW